MLWQQRLFLRDPFAVKVQPSLGQEGFIEECPSGVCPLPPSEPKPTVVPVTTTAPTLPIVPIVAGVVGIGVLALLLSR